jgi:hypothetical protein
VVVHKYGEQNNKNNMKIKTILNFGLAFMVFAGCNAPAPKANTEVASDSDAVVGQMANPAVNSDKSTNLGKPDETRLVGEWLRTDGVYRIKILSATPDGKLDAGYFNPNPIHVGQADWKVKDKNIIITVVLRDVNYPGSTYTLQYFPNEDRLAGNYYQAVERANYDVEFMRQK